MNDALWKLHFPEFPASNDHVVKQLMDSASLINLEAKCQVFYPGKACEHYLLMLFGSIKAQILSADGREILLYHVRPGDSCVLTTSCLLGNNYYPAEGITETEVSAFLIPAPVFHRCLGLSAFFREFVFRNFSARLTDVIKRMENISFGSVDQKLARLLIAHSEDDLPRTHSELALETGAAREVVSRHLKRFENYGWLSLSRGCIHIINREALSRVIDIV
jgi:CRP/FNR family transcriptional regulator, anaerobic regulatory protein